MSQHAQLDVLSNVFASEFVNFCQTKIRWEENLYLYGFTFFCKSFVLPQKNFAFAYKTFENF